MNADEMQSVASLCDLTAERDALRAALAQDAFTYSSRQATQCAGCGVHKHTPLRRDEMGGYVCLTCIDEALSAYRAALEEVCRCVGCKGTGKRLYLGWREPIVCLDCAGTGRDYHGSGKAQKLLEGK